MTEFDICMKRLTDTRRHQMIRAAIRWVSFAISWITALLLLLFFMRLPDIAAQLSVLYN